MDSETVSNCDKIYCSEGDTESTIAFATSTNLSEPETESIIKKSKKRKHKCRKYAGAANYKSKLSNTW